MTQVPVPKATLTAAITQVLHGYFGILLITAATSQKGHKGCLPPLCPYFDNLVLYTIEHSKKTDKTLPEWKKSNPNLFKKQGNKTLLHTHSLSFIQA